jgi:hypothetical protein
VFPVSTTLIKASEDMCINSRFPLKEPYIFID